MLVTNELRTGAAHGAALSAHSVFQVSCVGHKPLSWSICKHGTEKL